MAQPWPIFDNTVCKIIKSNDFTIKKLILTTMFTPLNIQQ